MSTNTFITPTDVIMDANLFLADQLVVGNLVNRTTETRFASKVGDTVKVKVPPSLAASKFTGATVAANLSQSSVDVVLQEHFYVRVDLTSDELTQKLDDFNVNVTLPSVRGLIASVEEYFIAKIVGGFARNLVGTSGNEPSTHAHILAGEKQIFVSKGDTSQLIGLITPTAHTSFAQLNIFTSADYGADRPGGLQSNSLGKLANITYFRSPYAGTFDQGDIAGTVLVMGASQTGTSLVTNGYTAATGTVKEGTRLTIAGITGTYIVSEDCTIAGNACTLKFTSALASSPADDAALTFGTTPKENVIYNPSSVAGAILPGAIVGPNVAALNIMGVGCRIISNVSVETLAGSWVFDLYCGAKVVRNEYGAVFCG